MEREENSLMNAPPCAGEWQSQVPRGGGTERGIFNIKADGSGGDFDGAPVMSVTCTGNRITITRMIGVNIFVYDGIITVVNVNVSRIKGTRTRVRSFVDERGEERPAASVDFVQEEWVAEKGGIVELNKTEETQPE